MAGWTLLPLSHTNVCKLDVFQMSPRLNFVFDSLMGEGGGMSRQDDFDALERLPCRAARIIYNFPKDMPSAEVLASAKWDTLRTRYKLSILKLIYKIFHNVSPSCMSIHISKLQPSYNLRRRHLIVIPSFRTNIMKSSIAYRGAILWNHFNYQKSAA